LRLGRHGASGGVDGGAAGRSDVVSRIVNVKPSRIGGLRPLLELYAHFCRMENKQATS